MKIAVFASGSGSNFAAIMQAIKAGRLPLVEMALVVCDRAGAFVIQRAKQERIPVFLFRANDYPDKSSYEKVIVEELRKYEVEMIVLAGYMRLLGPTLLESYSGKIINLHPSLLPSFAGKDAIGQALEYGVKVTGVTVHFVDEGMDTGPIIAQRAITVEEGETKESLTRKIQVQEHVLLPEVIKMLSDGKVILVDRKVVIRS